MHKHWFTTKLVVPFSVTFEKLAKYVSGHNIAAEPDRLYCLFVCLFVRYPGRHKSESLAEANLFQTRVLPCALLEQTHR
jgi:hypothetical protein